MNKKNISQFFLILFLFVLCVLMLAPFSWMISTSLRLPRESFRFPPAFLPTDFHIENYIKVFRGFPFARTIFNSLKIAVIVVIVNVFISTMAGYAFARIDFKGKNVVFLIMLSGMMIPGSVKLIPNYIVMSKLGLVGTHAALILPATIGIMNIFFVRQFMKTIPTSYEDAAYIDGAGRWTIYRMIFLPMSKSVIIMTSLGTFLGSWNDFLQPMLYLNRYEKMTLPIGLSTLRGLKGVGNEAVVIAGAVISLVVPLLLFLFGQKYILRGVVMSGLKA